MNNMKDVSVQDIIDYCDKLTEEGRVVKLVWSGGHDEGWVNLQVDDIDDNSLEAEWLISKMEEELDYGSWTTEYSISGEAVYDSVTKNFSGDTDEFHESESTRKIVPYIFKIPKNFNYQSFEIYVENSLIYIYFSQFKNKLPNVTLKSQDVYESSEEFLKIKNDILSIIKDLEYELEEEGIDIIYFNFGYNFWKENAIKNLENSDENYDVYQIDEIRYNHYVTESYLKEINLLELLENEKEKT